MSVTEAQSIHEISHVELSELIKRVEYAIEHDLALSVEDMKLLLLAITTLFTLQASLENREVTIHKLQKLLGMVRQSEKRRKESGGPDDPPQTPEDALKAKRKKKTIKKSDKDNKKNKKPPKVAVIHYALETAHSGMECPECHMGKLYKHTPGQLLRVTGHATYSVANHVTERLRCNACQAIEAAPLPPEVIADGGPDEKYGYSARAVMAIHKFFSGIPYHHQEKLSALFGESISASTIFDQVEKVSNAVMPIYHELKRQASNAELYLLDDTHNRILEQRPEHKPNRNAKGTRLRTGVYSSGLIALTAENREIVLFETSLGHAGELLDSILKKRALDLPSPITMSDALSSNNPTVRSVKSSYCNAHCRRQFVDLEKSHPEEVEWVLETYGTIWGSEHIVKDQGLAPQKRLEYHQAHSLPAMESLRTWGEQKQSAEDFEANSPMGKAISYLLRHYDRLTLFCREEKALLDNNRMEETLKMIIRGRKTSHFYKTKIGADVANVLLSMIATGYRADIELFTYLIVIQRHQKHVKENPEQWLPWTYEKTLRRIEAPDKIEPPP